jgi:hypothetical protein
MRKLFVLLVAALMALASPAAAVGPEAPRLQVQQATSQFDKYAAPRGPGLIMSSSITRRPSHALVRCWAFSLSQSSAVVNC